MGAQAMTRKERDPLIAQLYREGWTQPDLASRFSLSVARIGQILKQAGLEPADRPREATSERTQYVGFQLTPFIKQALQAEAKREKTSMSKYIAEAVAEKLKRDGVALEDPMLATLDLPRLPFSEEIA